jgi:hypothetical protein
MRKTTSGTLVLLGLGALVTAAPAGCFFNLAGDCEFNMTLDCFYGSAGGSGGTGGSGGSPPECTPSEQNPNVDGSCGVFVSPAGSDTEGDGSKEKPYLTLGAALTSKEVVAGKPVYACADETKPFDEAVSLSSEVTVYGGLDCANDWVYDPKKKSAWTAPADSVPLTVGSGANVAIFDFALAARDAAKDGGSSIAVLASQAGELLLERCDVVAGNGRIGAAPEKPAGTGAQGGPGEPGQDGCVDLMVKPGGTGGQNECEGTSRNGGNGGNGTAVDGSDGTAGQPQPGVPPSDGAAGKAQIGGTSCTTGVQGGDGTSGQPADGGQGIGTITAEGYIGTPGADGQQKGVPGQGGGGGGGAKKCLNMNYAGPGGGGGGAGGCGGLPGKGGGAGGASMAIISIGAIITLRDVAIQTGNGGLGGTGGDGQSGGLGGTGGDAGSNSGDGEAKACNGGDGGKGGDGSPGGGGQGGHSLGIAFQGKPVTTTNVTMKLGTPGNGGPGGSMTLAPNAFGAPGQKCQTLDFNAGGSSCVP